jgi:rare lipoprotein A
MTAAHRTLPLGTWVHVKGPGGSAMVRINDRGPYIGGRIIDLSAAAAQAVGVQGLGTVTITVQQ